MRAVIQNTAGAYRALVRAKVEALRVDQEHLVGDSYREHLAPAIDYIELAAEWASSHRAGLIVMHGLSGSGKSTVAAQLAEALGALQVRSDVERKRLFELAATADSESALGQGIYTAEATAATYQRLGEVASEVMAADFTVIVDATLLQESQRWPFLELESGRPGNRIIIDCEAPEDELRRRIVAREHDASEANLEVLTHQLQTHQPLSPREREIARVVTIGSAGLDASKIEEIRSLLFS
jgi:predicted kinase